ncbi:Sucrose phosphorylase [Planctomycetes bacterium Pan216]|uniref:Sucrose phosphorylase n=1 Tax=Kolteria novifilia TaxID=2527975 RepID=A0A518BCQ4_9BACT|nr:Sucrose phosphorylase [Planctomycetes bacterium Pan216]
MLDTLASRLRPRLTRLYGTDVESVLERLVALAEKHLPDIKETRSQRWDQRDVFLITYGDQIQRDQEAPLATLHHFLRDRGLGDCLSTVHVLPFFPYSSDDGFSIIDFVQVDPALGTWDDLADLQQDADLMADLVLNHLSSKSEWFQAYLAGDATYERYFIEEDPAADVSSVRRPRSLPLLTRFETSRGTRYIWTTFSDDQIDLNYKEPDVLIAMMDVFLTYLSHGARIIRLDAVGYVWKELGTSCIHLPEAHELVKLMRDVLDVIAPHRILITETNVPHAENISYFGDGDEAHMVYQFSLPPLLLDALLTGDSAPLAAWAKTVCESAPGTTFFNFTASHDGIGVTPLAGLVSDERFGALVEAARSRGAHVSTKTDSDGGQSPYELNVTYYSALAEPGDEGSELHQRRFLASQTIMMSLRGIPAIYFHSLVGTPNDVDGAARTGRARSINRRKFQLEELDAILDDASSPQRKIFDGLKQLLEIRTQQAAFHPEAPQMVLESKDPALFGFRRTSMDGTSRIIVLANVSGAAVEADMKTLDMVGGWEASRDLISGRTTPEDRLVLEPYQVMWLTNV